MNQKELQEKIAEYYQKLSPKAQEFFSAMRWMKILNDIKISNNLDDEQTETLGIETTLVLLGLITIEEYINILKENNINDDIIKEIEFKIFREIKNEIEISYNKNLENLEGNKDLSIISDDTTQKIYDIATKYKLPIDKMGKVEEITNKFLKGEVSSTQYENELSLATDLSPTQTADMVKDINENIIRGVREEMKREISSTQYVASSTENTNKEIDIPPKPPVIKIEENKETVPANLPIMGNNEKNKEPKLEIEEMPLELEEGGVSSTQYVASSKEGISNKEQVESSMDEIPLPSKEGISKPDISQQIESIIKDSKINPVQHTPQIKKVEENKTETQAKIFKDSGIEILPVDNIPTKDGNSVPARKSDPYRESID